MALLVDAVVLLRAGVVGATSDSPAADPIDASSTLAGTAGRKPTIHHLDPGKTQTFNIPQ